LRRVTDRIAQMAEPNSDLYQQCHSMP